MHYKAAYGDLANAVSKSDGIAVLGMLLEVSPANTFLSVLTRWIFEPHKYEEAV